MKTEIENEYKKIIELLKKVNIKQYSDPEELDEVSEIKSFLEALKPLIVDIVEFEKLLKKEIQSLPKESTTATEDVSSSKDEAGDLEVIPEINEELVEAFDEMEDIPNELGEDFDSEDLDEVRKSLKKMMSKLA